MMRRDEGELAILGGKPVRRGGWPSWPSYEESTFAMVRQAMQSGRWAISGADVGVPSYEQRFSRAFADFHETAYCVATDHGSSALVIAFEALGIGPGCEVIVPALTWVACASAVFRTGAVPCIVDIDPATLCLTVDRVREAVTDRTRAILLVHPYCSLVNLDSFTAFSRETGIPIVEDCSQAHGAAWRGQRVGTFGCLGIFSMQQEKVLTCGEGGAVITSDSTLYNRLQQLRADGRRYPTCLSHTGLERVGDVQGWNFCLSELHAAILLDRLPYLDRQNQRRAKCANIFRELIAPIKEMSLPVRRPEVTAPSYYRLCVQMDEEALAGVPVDVVCRALAMEVALPIRPLDDPLSENRLYNPLRSSRCSLDEDLRERLDPARLHVPNAVDARKRWVCLPHWSLLGSRRDIEDIAAAFRKVLQNIGTLAEAHVMGELRCCGTAPIAS